MRHLVKNQDTSTQRKLFYFINEAVILENKVVQKGNFRDQFIRGSARQCFGRISDLTQLQHSVTTEMGLDFQCGCGPSL